MRQIVVALLVSVGICLTGTGFTSAQQSYNLKKYESTTGKKVTEFHESPMLRTKVAAGELPPVEERLPENPLVIEPYEEIGQYGGTLIVKDSGGFQGRKNPNLAPSERDEVVRWSTFYRR